MLLEERSEDFNLTLHRAEEELGPLAEQPAREKDSQQDSQHGCRGEKAPQQKSLQGLIFTQSRRRDLNRRPMQGHQGVVRFERQHTSPIQR